MKKEVTIIEVTVSELIQVLMTLVVGQFCHIVMCTDVKMNKGGRSGVPLNPFFGRVKKLTKGSILVGNSYQKRVGNETENPDFVPEKNNNGEHISTVLVHSENTGNTKLQYEWFEQVQPKSEFILDGENPIEKELFKSYMSTYTPNKYGVNFQNVCVQNIKEITINHNKYVVKVEVPQEMEVV